MTEQYLRKLSVVVAKDSGEGLEFASFKVQFSIIRGDFQTPNSCDVRILQLIRRNRETNRAERIYDVSVSAGYEGNFAPNFPKSTIKQFRLGRIDALDSYVDLTRC